MFTEYASRVIQHSQLRFSQNRHKPLFQSTNDGREDIRESLALRQSRAGIGSRFGLFQPIDDEEDHGDDEDSDHEAMKSSWVPPDYRRLRSQRPVEIGITDSMESIEPYGDRVKHERIDDDETDRGSQHNEPPMDIAYEGQTDHSLPPRSLTGSVEALPESDSVSSSRIQDSITLKSNRIPPTILEPQISSSLHDRGYAAVFMMCQASIFATSLFVWLTTDTSASPMTDTIYNALASSMGLITRDIFIALAISAIWLVALKTFIRPLLHSIVIVVPLILLALSSYMFSWSYQGVLGGYELQAKAMRWSSLLMLSFAVLWIYSAWTGRQAMMKTISIIKLACTILEQNSALLLLGLGSLVSVVIYSFIWLHQFERIFLRGRFEGIGAARQWFMNSNSWILGAYFIFMYLWTFAVVSGIQRCTTGAAVSHWYFHRHDLPKAPQVELMKGTLLHSLSTSFGSICASSLLALLTRLPLIVLPRRFSGLFSVTAYLIFSAPLQSLMSPVTLSYAAIHSLDIKTAANGILQNPVLGPNNTQAGYRTAKMLLSAARATTALGLGIAAWIASARGSEQTASVFGYVVGLVAGGIGWAVVGSIEGVVSMIVDAAFVCYGTDLPSAREGRSHCLEATNAFGNVRSVHLGALQV